MTHIPPDEAHFAASSVPVLSPDSVDGSAAALFDAIPSALLILLPDERLTVAAATDGYLQSTRSKRQDVVGQPLSEMLSKRFGLATGEGQKVFEALASSLHTKLVSEQVVHEQAESEGCESNDSKAWKIKNVPVLVKGAVLCIILCIEGFSDRTPAISQGEAATKAPCTLAVPDSPSRFIPKRKTAIVWAIRTKLSRSALRQDFKLDEGVFKLITDAVPQSVWTARPDGYVQYFNRQFSEFAGTPPEAAEDGLWVNFVHPDDVSKAQAAWQHSVATEEPYETTFRVRHRSGEYRWTLVRALSVRRDNEVIMWVGTNTDIHDKVLAEEALRETNRRKDEFLAMLAHELRNPLVPIVAGAEMLSKAPTDEQRVTQLSDMIRRQIAHMTSLIDDLLDVSRVTRGLIVLEDSIVDLEKVVQEAAEQTRPLFDVHQHELNLLISGGPLCVRGDHTRLVQALSNLLNNAAKYTPDSGTILIEAKRTASDVVVRVKDNGVGMAADLLRRAFDLFEQGERSAARTEGGLGVGLALSRSLIEQHQGSVTATSGGHGRGSEFTVRLPCIQGATATDRLTQQKGPSTAHKKHHVLLVEDNTEVADAMAMILEMLGHSVAIEHDGGGAIERARQESFTTFILDIGLPDMDGYELARQLKAMSGTKDAVFVAHTGYGQKEDKQLSAQAGFSHHLVKPAALEDLERVLAI